MSNYDGAGGSDRQGELEDQLALVEDEVRRVPTKEHVDHVERRVTRLGKMAVVTSLIISVLAVAGCVFLAVWVSRNEAQSTITDQAIEDLREANRLRVEQGLPEIPLPGPGETVDANSVAAMAAALLLEDIRDDSRFRGPEGDAGAPGTPGQGGDTGQPGRDGTDGSSGQDGDPGRGVDYMVVDGSGDLWVHFTDSYPPMRVGHVVGPTGPKGEIGPIGPQGTAGPACMPGWHPETLSVVTGPLTTQEIQACIQDSG